VSAILPFKAVFTTTGEEHPSPPRDPRGLVQAATVLRPMDGAEGNLYTPDDQRQACPVLSHGTEHEETEKGEKEEEGCFCAGQPQPTTAVAIGYPCQAGEGGDGGVYHAYGRSSGILAAGASGCCCCPQHWCESQCTNAKTIQTSRLSRRRRRPAAPEASNARGESGLEPRRGDNPPAAVGAAVVAVEAGAEGDVCTAATATGGVRFGSKLGPSSKAAVEAWEAAETWALAVAATTGAVSVEAAEGVAAGESLSSVEAAEGLGYKDEVLGVAATGEPDQHIRRNCRDVDAPTQTGRGCPSCCRCSISGGPAAMIGVCQSAAHRRDSVLVGESKVQVDTAHRWGGRGRSCAPPLVDACPRYDLAQSPPQSDARSFVVPSAVLRTSTTGATTTGRPVALGAAAAIVLARIDLGEKSWATRARRAGFAALKAGRERAGRRTVRDTAAARHREASLRIRGLRAWAGRARWKKGRREAAIAAAVVAAEGADAFSRARRLRRVVAMLKR